MSDVQDSNLATLPALAGVISDVLGNLAFLVSDDQTPQLPPGASWIEGRIAYQGPYSGELRCWCTHNFATQLAANLLGLEPDSKPVADHVCDAVQEFMNIVCGQLITTCHGSSTVFDLSIPTATCCAGQPPLGFSDETVHCGFSVSGEPLFCAYVRRSG